MMERVVVVGNSGSGKSTLAKRLAASIDAVHIEIDAFMWLPGWQKRSGDQLREQIDAQTDSGPWVVCGNARSVRDLVWQRADTIIVLDLPRHVVMWRVLRRSSRRVFRREVLWSGNRERLRDVLALHNPDRSIIAWSWTQHRRYRDEYRNAVNDPTWADKTFIVCRDQHDVDRLLSD